MSSAEKKNKLGRLTGGSAHEREALQLRTYHEHLQNNKTLQGIAVSTDSVASPEQRTRIISRMNTLNEEGVLRVLPPEAGPHLKIAIRALFRSFFLRSVAPSTPVRPG